ncbi:MAG: 4Fe-4S dicluster domain-containing protein [Desulfobacterales bacterium]|nr:4Fe-4S dicluster domain-containing protein [Desulfobacterales bacterium]
MKTLKVKKGYRLNIQGAPSLDLEALETPTRVGATPENIPFIKPRLCVKSGDEVKVGSVLFEDKRNPDIKFVSPGGGKIVQINFGPRRVIQQIVIELDPEEKHEEFEKISEKDIENIDRNRLVKLLTAGGLWPLIREFPFRDIAVPERIPPAIIVSLGALEPFQPDCDVYLKESMPLFKLGLQALGRLVEKNVYVSICGPSSMDQLNGLVTHSLIGDYPADDPGVLLYYTRKSSSDNRCWYINGQDVLLLAQLLISGQYPTERIVVRAGSLATGRKHIKTRAGVPLSHLAGPEIETDNCRYVVGGIFRGYAGREGDYLGFYETSLTLLPLGEKTAVLDFVRPGFAKPSYSRTFLSSFNRSALNMDCKLHGDVRACVACGSCNRICPVDILPQLTYKSILADALDESLAHGLLDCVECGLCSYVCPSKIELTLTLRNAKKAYYKEQV